jgi:hypothetical protein
VEGSRESSPSGLRHGARAVRAATTNSQPGAALREYGDDAVGWPARRARACGAKGEGLDGGSTRAVPLRTDRRVVGCLGIQARGVVAVSARDVARRDATSCDAGAPAQNSSKYLTLN